jgi:uncharacterized membrane protein YccC
MIGAADYSGKAVYGMKVALALTLVSLFYYARPLYDGVGGRNVVWAIMTVVLVFEYTVGGSMYKGFNRTVGTISGAGLALAVHWVASKSGKTLEPVVASGSVFLLGTYVDTLTSWKKNDQHGAVLKYLRFNNVQQLPRRSRASYRW